MIIVDNETTVWYPVPMMGNRLKDIMEREGVSAYRLCKDLGLDKGQVSRFLHGKQNLALDKVEKVADYLGYDLQWVKRKPSQERR
jgi:transcriptional regulator with XRE-family HTH domain